jgi:phosphohistidine phosphatase
MPRLLLLRHAKSSWGDPGLADIDRPLSPRGRRNAATMAKAIDAEGLVPDRILCSPARRTRETLAALLPYLGGEGRVSIDPKLYDSGPSDYLGAISRSGSDAGTLMVIGHNPAIHATAQLLTGDGEPGLADELAAKYPTGALAVIDFGQVSWSRLDPHSGFLVAFLKPRDLDPGDDGDDAED